jgi:hypothetical protein
MISYYKYAVFVTIFYLFSATIIAREKEKTQ